MDLSKCLLLVGCGSRTEFLYILFTVVVGVMRGELLVAVIHKGFKFHSR